MCEIVEKLREEGREEGLALDVFQICKPKLPHTDAVVLNIDFLV